MPYKTLGGSQIRLASPVLPHAHPVLPCCAPLLPYCGHAPFFSRKWQSQILMMMMYIIFIVHRLTCDLWLTQASPLCSRAKAQFVRLLSCSQQLPIFWLFVNSKAFYQRQSIGNGCILCHGESIKTFYTRLGYEGKGYVKLLFLAVISTMTIQHPHSSQCQHSPT